MVGTPSLEDQSRWAVSVVAFFLSSGLDLASISRTDSGAISLNKANTLSMDTRSHSVGYKKIRLIIGLRQSHGLGPMARACRSSRHR